MFDFFKRLFKPKRKTHKVICPMCRHTFKTSHYQLICGRKSCKLALNRQRYANKKITPDGEGASVTSSDAPSDGIKPLPGQISFLEH